MNCVAIVDRMVTWTYKRVRDAGANGLVVGVSGGVDSGLVSTICALTGLPVYAVSLPINRFSEDRVLDDALAATIQLKFLSGFANVHIDQINLIANYDAFVKTMGDRIIQNKELVLANAQSRQRMEAIYGIANSLGYMVAGTGNKVEDFGCGFFTKWGDGGVDISPIGDLLKSHVRELATFLKIPEQVANAVPTDGLWEDGRSDESQIGATYDELEWAMDLMENDGLYATAFNAGFSDRQKEVLKIYVERHTKNQHKMCMPPICEIPKEYLK